MSDESRREVHSPLHRRSSSKPFVEQCTGDDVLVNLGGGLVDPGDLRVAVESFDVVVVDEAGPAVDLDGLVGDVGTPT